MSSSSTSESDGGGEMSEEALEGTSNIVHRKHRHPEKGFVEVSVAVCCETYFITNSLLRSSILLNYLKLFEAELLNYLKLNLPWLGSC